MRHRFWTGPSWSRSTAWTAAGRRPSPMPSPRRTARLAGRSRSSTSTLPPPARLPSSGRTRLAQGYFLHNYDLDAFRKSVLEPLRARGSRTIIRRFLTTVGTPPCPTHRSRRPTTPWSPVEGMFLHRDELAASWDVSVFLLVPFAVPVRRLAERDGSNPDRRTTRWSGTSRGSASTCRGAVLSPARPTWWTAAELADLSSQRARRHVGHALDHDGVLGGGVGVHDHAAEAPAGVSDVVLGCLAAEDQAGSGLSVSSGRSGVAST